MASQDSSGGNRIYGNVHQSAVVSGSHNKVSVGANSSTDGSADLIELRKELQKLGEVLRNLHSPDSPKITNAVGDADTELQKPNPSKDEVGEALERAIKYAKKADEFGKSAASLKPYVQTIVTWLGPVWQRLVELLN